MIERYTRPAMGRIWTEENKYRCWLEVESAASTVLAEYGVVPADAAEAIATKATVSAKRVAEIEAEVKHDVIAFTTTVAESLKAQGLAEGYIRPIAWRGSEEMGVAAKATKINLAVACWDWGSYFPMEERLKGIRLRFADYRRPDPMTAPCKAKATGLYMICTIEKHRSMDTGYADALMLDYRGLIAEATGANVFFVKDGKLHTPAPDCFLDGITRRTVIGLAKKRGIETVERQIQPEELAGFEQCFLTGSAAEVTPVSEIGQYRFTVGEITKTLMDDYSANARPKHAAAE